MYKILLLVVGCFVSIQVVAIETGSSCHARAIEAVELKAVADGRIQRERLFVYEVSARRAGRNMYIVTLAAGDTEPKIIYKAFSDYREQGLGTTYSVDCKIESVLAD